MKRYQGAVRWAPASSPAPTPAEVERAEATRAAGFTSDVIVPLVQSLVTGSLLGGLALVVLGEVLPTFDGDPVKVWIGVTLGVAAASWLLLLRDTRRLLWGIERLIGLDLDRDQQVGKPRERVVVVNAGHGQREAEQRAKGDRRSQFSQFVAEIPAKGTAIRAWEGDLSREVYTDYRDTLIRVGWAEWCSVGKDGTPNETKGWRLTVEPAYILERISG